MTAEFSLNQNLSEAVLIGAHRIGATSVRACTDDIFLWVALRDGVPYAAIRRLRVIPDYVVGVKYVVEFEVMSDYYEEGNL